MPGPQKRKRQCHSGDTHLRRKWRTRNRKKDLDQVDKDLKPENAVNLLKQEIDIDKPGNAQFYCLHCTRYFINDHALKHHFTQKTHKKRLKQLELEPYTIEESERAAGFGSFQAPKRRKIETQPLAINDTGNGKSEEESIAENQEDFITE